MASPTIDTRPVSRRSLARGVAWAAPVIVAASAVPAYAASSCVPTLTISGGLIYRWGTLGRSSTTQSLDVGAQAYVRNLPDGVTVTRVSYQWGVTNRIGQDSAGPGAFWVGNGTSSRNGENYSAMRYTPGGGTAWRNTVSNTGKEIDTEFPDGQTRKAWDLNFLWSAGTNGSNGTYTEKDDAGCRDFTTGPSGRFRIDYSGVTAPRTCPSPEGKMPNFVYVTATLSNGQELKFTGVSDGGSNCG